MEAVMIASGFEKSPFIFKGSGLYQIHLVKAETIRPFIPKELRLVEILGYTCGGFYLGNYGDSSFGAFDELVVIAGTVWSGRSYCAWTSKVLVSNDEVRNHARKEFGVPSQVANFSKEIKATPLHTHERKPGDFLNINGLGNSNQPKNYNDIQIREIKDKGATESCNISIKSAVAAAAPHLDFSRLFISPRIKLSLPNLSGLTEYNPQLLEYTCHIETRVRVVAAAKVLDEFASDGEDYHSSDFQSIHQVESAADMRNAVTRIVLRSKPFVAFEFNPMKMIVDSPSMSISFFPMGAVITASGFGKPPLIFEGSALFQIHAVKAERVRPFIPKELRIVETLGYTVGGFFLADYEDSPFGAFDELVVIAGIVRNDRSSCAWAANVFVNSEEARDSGRKEFGLPSQVANFSKKIRARHEIKPGGFLNLGNSKWPKNYNDIQIREIKDEGATNSCNFSIKTAGNCLGNSIISPKIKLSLPNLSGLTVYNPRLLEYTCQIEARVGIVAAAKVSDELASDYDSSDFQSIDEMNSANMRSAVARIVLQSKPFAAFEFNSMKMVVNSPTLVSQH